ncbi:MAG: hypothetical protein PUE71_10180 [Clostridia bacterium]|nr:hypothetical protein [Clostridia bacterium]
MVTLLKKETLPLVMWGCGDVADAVFEYLNNNGVAVSGVWVDGDAGRKNYNGIEIDDRKAILEKFEKFNVILGHSHYDKGELVKNEISRINKVFYAFSIHYGQYDKVPYADIEAQADRFVNLCNDAADEQSVKNLLAYLNTKMTGDVRYIFDVYKKKMSFYSNDVFRVTGSEVFVDIGAYNGDTIRQFLEETGGKYKKIIALEPDNKSFLELNDYVAGNRMTNVITSKMGAWNTTTDLKFKTGNEQISSVCIDGNESDENVITIYADRIDRIFDEPVSYIKINYYEGVLEAIEGCENIIRKYQPKLGIDVGFDIYNVLKLYEYIKSLDIGYKFYLRFNRAMSSTFTLYAVTE